MTVLTRCKSRSQSADLRAFCCIIYYFYMGVVDDNNTFMFFDRGRGNMSYLIKRPTLKAVQYRPDSLCRTVCLLAIAGLCLMGQKHVHKATYHEHECFAYSLWQH